ncbi:MAG: hypothetical protein ABI835_06845 [Chloroflexota bacterium]
MTQLPNLIQSNQLKTGYLAEMARSKQHQATVKYDRDFDALLVFFQTENTQIVAHYVDDYVALLYIAENLEIVGLQIEDFTLSFLPAHENVARLWQLRGTGEEVSDMGDIIFYAEKIPKVAQEVVKAAEELLGEQGQELAAAFG